MVVAVQHLLLTNNNNSTNILDVPGSNLKLLNNGFSIGPIFTCVERLTKIMVVACHWHFYATEGDDSDQ